MAVPEVRITRLDMTEAFKEATKTRTCLAVTFEGFFARYCERIVEQQVKAGIPSDRAKANAVQLRGTAYSAFMAAASIMQSVFRVALAGDVQAMLDAEAIFEEFDAHMATAQANAAMTKAAAH